MQNITIEQARKALDDMDDFARMNVGVDAKGARGVLEKFIEQTRQREVLGVTQECALPDVASTKPGDYHAGY